MARRNVGRGIAATSERIVSVSIEAGKVDAIAAVTGVRTLRPASLQWWHEDRLYLADIAGDGEAAEGFARELTSPTARRYWTSEGMIGRLRALCACPAFQDASVVDAVALFVANEECMRPAGLRRVFRYVFGVGDAELYATLRELMRKNVISAASVRPDDANAFGPFILFPVEYGRDCWIARHGEKGMTWYSLLTSDVRSIDLILMRMFLECADDLDDVRACGGDITPYAALCAFYDDGTGTIEDCYGFIRDLLEIGTRERCSRELASDDAQYMRAIAALDRTINKRRGQLSSAIRQEKQGEVFYIPPRPDLISSKLYADDEDCRHAREILHRDTDSLRKDSKSGRTIHAEIIRHVLDAIPKIFSLKSMYEIFDDMEPEVVRRNVRSLCSDGTLIKAGRGQYCSRLCADKYFMKHARNEEKGDDTVLEQILKEQFEQLEKAVDFINREVGKMHSRGGKNNGNSE